MNTIVFAGDSITDCDRRADPAGLGDGYVRLVADALGGAARVVNVGISGNSARDLRDRWKTDVLAEQPSLVSVLVGINDTWRRYDSGTVTTAAEFESNYRALLTSLAGVRIVLIEPFLLPVRDEQVAWREDLDPKVAVVRALAAEFGAVLVPADTALAAAGAAADVAPDGIHPSAWGHELLAKLWLEHARL
ncbi:lysophospholipase L1-like esterase [Asanoa ferruginea]|uniref:Lysophospholipase L1-like esterase n=1 Tax=Asanoa ferruginea TaxID=53367 RepID=A0A3D9ZRL8_9ACTN|nr:SGNH/GDSL hydrolase family protein [Asanoa ferruginea]REG00049.1 lysophospholipase L1-like esterase [Asanoa ferruginea]GIF46259.1 lipase [Asanoa ferruginea]